VKESKEYQKASALCYSFPLWRTYVAAVADSIHSQYASYNCTCTQAGVQLAEKKKFDAKLLHVTQGFEKDESESVC